MSQRAGSIDLIEVTQLEGTPTCSAKSIKSPKEVSFQEEVLEKNLNFSKKLQMNDNRRLTVNPRDCQSILQMISGFNNEKLQRVNSIHSQQNKNKAISQDKLMRDLQEEENFNERLKSRRLKSPMKNQKSQIKIATTKEIEHGEKQNKSFMHTASNIQIKKSNFWQPMSTEGQFIILIVADTFLCNDYEYSLKISEQDFSYVANTSLFEGNILRFRALASIKLFEFTET